MEVALENIITSYTEKELARELNISLSKLRQDRKKRIGFPFVRISKSIRYPLTESWNILKKSTHSKESLKLKIKKRSSDNNRLNSWNEE